MYGTAKLQALSVAVMVAFAAAASTNRVLTTAAELAEFTNVEWNDSKFKRFDLEATVTFPCDRRCRTFAAEDETGSVILREISTRSTTSNPPLPVLRRGDRIHVSGCTTRHETTGISSAEVKSLKILGHVQMPPPAPVPPDELRDPIWQNRFIRLRGTVQDAFHDEIDSNWNYIVIRSGRETIYAPFTTDGTDGDRLKSIVDAEIEVEGLNTPFNRGNRRMIGFMLHISGWDAIIVTKPAPTNPFGVPLLDANRDTSAAISSGIGRRRTKGRVLAVWHKDRILLRTKEGRIVRVDLSGGDPPEYGATIEAAGLPETDLYRLNLSRAIWRPAGETVEAEPKAESVTVGRLTTSESNIRGIQTAYHGKAIRMKGIVRSLPSPGGDGRLGLECDGQIVPVDASACPDAFDGVEIGCVLEVSGICLMETDNWRPSAPFPHVEGFAIVVRTPDDIRILARPPWWTRGRLLSVIGTLLAALFGIFAWNRMLNRRAEQRGKELAAEQVAHVTSDLKVYERTRLAVELHDSLSQNLTGVSLAIRAANQLADSDPDGMRKSLGLAAKSLDSCREELRNCLWDLRNMTLEESDMDEAIQRTLAPHVGDARLAIRFNVPRDRLSDNTAHSILHMIRELASNAVRHGNATEIKVAGAIENDRLLFSVSDNGRGFDPENRPTVADGHFGLQGIQDRVDGFEGEMTVQSAPGKGAKITISIKTAAPE
ncbi:MAG: sensor histidine kinase [Kiritimatiellae bacterium]|nr:sensor histidine kinase [Kiritimatiellia bacterium]